ncbi:hypothetical protein [Rhodanobacter sp. BL-MT-08]
MADAGWITVKRGWAGESRTKSVALTRQGRAVMTAANVHWEGIRGRIVQSFGMEPWGSLHKDIAELAALGVNLNRNFFRTFTQPTLTASAGIGRCSTEITRFCDNPR